MSAPREAEVSRAFVALASSLVNGYDVVDLLGELTTDCANILDIASAGLLLADQQGVLHVLAASSAATRDLELIQLQRDEGPCLECYRTGEPVTVPDMDTASDRWPLFVPAALAAGLVSVHALPMRLRDNVLGALGLFGTTVGSLNDEDLALGQALADVASVALIQDKAAANTAAVTEQLQTALSSRILIEQAKGVLAQRGDLDMEQAFAVLRGYARDNNIRLTAVAQQIVSRTLHSKTVLEHAHTKGRQRS